MAFEVASQKNEIKRNSEHPILTYSVEEMVIKRIPAWVELVADHYRNGKPTAWQREIESIFAQWLSDLAIANGEEESMNISTKYIQQLESELELAPVLDCDYEVYKVLVKEIREEAPKNEDQTEEEYLGLDYEIGNKFAPGLYDDMEEFNDLENFPEKKEEDVDLDKDNEEVGLEKNLEKKTEPVIREIVSAVKVEEYTPTLKGAENYLQDFLLLYYSKAVEEHPLTETEIDYCLEQLEILKDKVDYSSQLGGLRKELRTVRKKFEELKFEL